MDRLPPSRNTDGFHCRPPTLETQGAQLCFNDAAQSLAVLQRARSVKSSRLRPAAAFLDCRHQGRQQFAQIARQCTDAPPRSAYTRSCANACAYSLMASAQALAEEIMASTDSRSKCGVQASIFRLMSSRPPGLSFKCVRTPRSNRCRWRTRLGSPRHRAHVPSPDQC